MKKQIVSMLLVIAMLCAMMPAVFAAPAESAQVFELPVVNYDEAVANDEPALSLESADGITIKDVTVENFYADMKANELVSVRVAASFTADMRSKLKLELLDSTGTVVATQHTVYYFEYGGGLIYQLKLNRAINADSAYSLRFTYTGSYTLNNQAANANIWPGDEVAIKSAELLDASESYFKFALANAKSGDKFSFCYEDYSTGDRWADATVDANGYAYVKFGGAHTQEYMCIYLCSEGATDKWNDCLDEFEIEKGDPGNTYDDGVSYTEYISPTTTYLWIYFCNKAFNYESYTKDEAANVSAYLYDLDTKKKIGSITEKSFRDEWGEIEAKLTFNETLNASHKYALVTNDGYNVRIFDDIVVTADPKITNAYFYVNENDSSNTQPGAMPAGISQFYTRINMNNIPSANYGNVKAELLDASGKVVATSAYVTSNKYKTTATGPIAAGNYTMQVTYQNVTYKKAMTFVEGAAATWQIATRGTVHKGKVYIVAGIQSANHNPANLTYKVERTDGTVVPATYYRALYNNGNTHYFVVTVAASDLATVDGYQNGFVEMYQGSTYLPPTYANNNRFYVNTETDDAFVYDQCYVTDTQTIFYVEGESANTATYTLCAYDDATKTGKTVAMTYQASNKTLVVSNTSLNTITTKMFVERENVWNEGKRFHIERNGEYMTYLYGSFGKIVLEDEFSFSKTATQTPVIALNLPFMTYSQYKLATTEAGLASQSWKTIVNGLAYDLQEGTTAVYGQFKKADGTVSDVMKVSVLLDRTAPTVTIDFDEDAIYYIDEDGRLTLSAEVNASEAGKLYYVLYDADGESMDSPSYTRADAGEETCTFYVWNDHVGDLTKAKTLELYLEDTAGNQSQKYTFDIVVKNKEYVNYPIEGGSIYFCVDDGTVLSVTTSATKVEIPETINGTAVVAIGEDAFIDATHVTDITIPDCVTDIHYWAIYNMDGPLTIHANAGSAAVQYAQRRNYTVKYLEGLGITSCTRMGSNLSVYARCTTNGGEINGKVVFALYSKNGVMKEMYVRDAAAEGTYADFRNAANGDYVKAFWLNDMQDIVPKYEAKTVMVPEE